MIKELAEGRGAFGTSGLLAIQTVKVQIPEHRETIEVIQPPRRITYSRHVPLAALIVLDKSSVTRAADLLGLANKTR